MGKLLSSLLQAAAIAIGTVLGGPLGAIIATVAVSALVNGGGPRPDTQTTTIKTARPPRVSAYGRSRLYGAYATYDTAANGVAIDHYAVHDGEIDAIERRYLNDDQISLAGEFVVGAGSTSGGFFQAHTDGRYGGNKVSWYETLGQTPGTAGTWPAATLAPTLWGANHRGDGVVAIGLYCAQVKAEDFQDIYPQASVPMPSIVARWQKCPDPAAVDPLDESGWVWTENPVHQLLHYKIVREGPQPALPKSDPGYEAALAALRATWWARKIAPTLDLWIAAAAVCDEARSLLAGGTEPKYRSCVAHKHTDEHKGPVSALLATFDGWLAPRFDGALVIYAGKYYEPTESIGPDEITSYTWDGGRPDNDEAVNEIVCSYVSDKHDFNTVECDAWRDESDITARGSVLSAPLDAQVPSHAQARFLAKRVMARKNATARGTVTTSISGRRAAGHRFINLRLEEAGAVFFDGVAEITGLTRNFLGGVTFNWVAADPNVDAWNPATEEGEPAATGDRIASVALDPPLIDTVTPAPDSTGVRLDIEATGPDRDDLTWYVHWRVAGASTWGPDQVFSDTAAGAAVALLTDAVTAGATIEIQVAYRVGDGRRSPWSETATADTPEGEIIYDGGDAETV